MIRIKGVNVAEAANAAMNEVMNNGVSGMVSGVSVLTRYNYVCPLGNTSGGPFLALGHEMALNSFCQSSKQNKNCSITKSLYLMLRDDIRR